MQHVPPFWHGLGEHALSTIQRYYSKLVNHLTVTKTWSSRSVWIQNKVLLLYIKNKKNVFKQRGFCIILTYVETWYVLFLQLSNSHFYICTDIPFFFYVFKTALSYFWNEICFVIFAYLVNVVTQIYFELTSII